MYVRFTPKQLSILKKLLPTVKLNAYEIQIYQEIQQALENPIDEKQQNKPQKINRGNTKPAEPRSSFKPVEENKPAEFTPAQEVHTVQEETSSQPKEKSADKANYVNSIKSDESTFVSSVKEEKDNLVTKLESNPDEELEDISDNNQETNTEDQDSIFSVIDRRTK